MLEERRAFGDEPLHPPGADRESGANREEEGQERDDQTANRSFHAAGSQTFFSGNSSPVRVRMKRTGVAHSLPAGSTECISCRAFGTAASTGSPAASCW